MVKALLVGISWRTDCGRGSLFYFASGRAPVATAGPEMPFERRMAKMALHAYLDKLPHPSPQVPAMRRI